MKDAGKRLSKAVADFRTYMAQPASNSDVFAAFTTMACGGLAVMGILAAVLAYFNVFPRPH